MITLATALALSTIQPLPIEYEASLFMYGQNYSLSPQERDQIWNKIHFAIKKMNICMDKADRAASKITDINIRLTTKAAIQGAICGLGGRTPYAVVIGGCINALAHIGGEAYDNFLESRDHVRDAEYYAYEADRLQEMLWRDDDSEEY